MKVVRQKPHLLKIVNYPIELLLGGIVISAFFLVFSVAFSGKATLICQREQPGVAKAAKAGECRIKRSNIIPGWTSTEFYGLNEIYSAALLSSDDTSELVLSLRSQEIVKLSGVNNNAPGKENAKDSINDFLKDYKIASVQVKDGSDWGSLITSYGFGTVSLLCLVFAFICSQITICRFDKNTGRIDVSTFSLLGKDVIQHHLSHIEQVEVAETSSSEKSTYRLQIRLKQGETVPLTFTDTSVQGEVDKLMNTINQFLRSNAI